jgi:hypothetical protein
MCDLQVKGLAEEGKITTTTFEPLVGFPRDFSHRCILK